MQNENEFSFSSCCNFSEIHDCEFEAMSHDDDIIYDYGQTRLKKKMSMTSAALLHNDEELFSGIS